MFETKEYSKEKANLSDIIENDDDGDRLISGDGELPRKFTDTHFPTDFKVTLTEEGHGHPGEHILEHDVEGGRKESDDDMVRIDKEDVGLGHKDDLAHWKGMMEFSDRQIMDFVGRKTASPGKGGAEEKVEDKTAAGHPEHPDPPGASEPPK